MQGIDKRAGFPDVKVPGLLPSAAGAICLTLALFWCMQALISGASLPAQPPTVFAFKPVWYREPPTSPPPVRSKPVPPEVPGAEPEVPTTPDGIPVIASLTGRIAPVPVTGQPPQITIQNLSDEGWAVLENAVLADYPIRALERGLEGFVLVGFVIQVDGTVRDMKILESSDRLFEDAALKAASRLHYKPMIVDGRPVEVEHAYRFVFALDQ